MKRRIWLFIGSFLIVIGLVLAVAGAYMWYTGQTGKKNQDIAEQIEDEIDKSPPIPTNPKTIPKTPVSPGKPFGVIYIEKMNLKTPLVEGVADENLDDGVGHYPKTEIVGQKGNFGVAGHVCCASNGEAFRYLHTLSNGDNIRVTTTVGVFNYKVVPMPSCKGDRKGPGGHPLVTPDRSDVLFDKPCVKSKSPSRKLMTLTTCYPYGRDRTQWRLIVWAEMTDFTPRVL